MLRREYQAKPSECNANREVPLTLLTSQIIDIATDHANIFGIGFMNLEPKGLGWVLSRLSAEMKRWPRNGEKYFLSTWIESYNAHFSERCFRIDDSEGEAIGYARTIWMIIDLKTHKSEGTASTVMPEEMIAGLPCPIPRMAKERVSEPERTREYTFKYCDLDYYRHVNTVRYISILLNQLDLEDYDTHILSRFDIAFNHEAKYGETAIIKTNSAEGKTPGMQPQDRKSRKHIFTLTVGDHTVLTAGITMTSPHGSSPAGED